ncbi:MAG: hypothetical protein LBR34_01560 [Prevotella sp.]|jgi:hypothetical protein|nr:hypothetical protein [Prevotella sp.]
MSINNDIPNDVLAAIAMALYDIRDEVHDPESNVLTIRRTPELYLPWSDKALGMLQIPVKK